MNFKIKTSDYKTVEIDSWEVRRVLDNELNKILGDEFRYIREGVLYQWDEFTGDNIPLRETTPEEFELFDSFCNVMNHFIKLGMEEK